jgi:protein SCO1/2
MLRNRNVWIAVVALLLACGAAVLARFVLPAGPPAPDFTLSDQNGRPYTLSAHRGHVIALFFGYAHCPDECPTTLAALARAKRKAGAAGATFDVVLVTVDPARDTPAALKRYVDQFDPAFTAVTGSEAQLAPVYSAYHVVHEIKGDDIEHSTFVQFITPAGRLSGIGDWTDSPDHFVALMQQAQS